MKNKINIHIDIMKYQSNKMLELKHMLTGWSTPHNGDRIKKMSYLSSPTAEQLQGRNTHGVKTVFF